MNADLANLNVEKLKAKAHKPIVITMVSLVVILLGLYDIPEYVMAYRSQSWPTVKGMVQKVELSRKDYREGSATAFEILYAYSAGGAHIGSRIKFQQPMAWNDEDTIYLFEHYEQGKPAHVHYDPDNPSESCLISSPSISTVFLKGTLYCLFFLIFYLSFYPQLPDEKAEAPELREEVLAAER